MGALAIMRYTNVRFTYLLTTNNSLLCTARSSFFTERVDLVNTWNSLPADTDFSSLSLSGFIRQINRMDFTELEVPC